MQQRFLPCMSLRPGVDQLQLGESSVTISDKPSTLTGIFLPFTALHCPFPCKVPCICVFPASPPLCSLSLHLSYGSPVTLMGSKSRHSHSHRGSEAATAVTQTRTRTHIQNKNQNHLLGPAQTKNTSHWEPDRFKWTSAHTVTSLHCI